MTPTTHFTTHSEVSLPADSCRLDGLLARPPLAPALIIELERGGTALHTSRGAFIDDALQAAGFATLRVGLLSHEEERHEPGLWHQVATLSTRIQAVLDWIGARPDLATLPLGMLARDAATAAMIRVAARTKAPLRALASRSGRPDYAGLEPLQSLRVPILLVVGELDAEGSGPNQLAFDQLACERKLLVLPGASHLFEELGKLEEASEHLVAWFLRWLEPDAPSV